MYNVLYKDRHGNLVADTATAIYAGNVREKGGESGQDKTEGLFIESARQGVRNVFIKMPHKTLDAGIKSGVINLLGLVDLSSYGNALDKNNYDKIL